jgi:hypothetical protein
MQMFEVLRLAADVVRAGWSQGAPARDASGMVVPLFKPEAKDGINPAAESFSIYGAVVKVSHEHRLTVETGTWDLMFTRAKERLPEVLKQIHPISYLNDQPGQTQEAIVEFLEACATELESGVRMASPLKPAPAAVVEQSKEEVVDHQRVAGDNTIRLGPNPSLRGEQQPETLSEPTLLDRVGPNPFGG